MLNAPSKKSIQRAGDILKNPKSTEKEYSQAVATLSKWRVLHSYPINTFQANLRGKLKRGNYQGAIVAQRLKRTPSIVRKLRRFPDMNLARMQDIGGIRVILQNIEQVYQLHQDIITSGEHEAELPPKDYISSPKADGYRSLHQVFKYKSKTHPELNGLRVELQIRTELQHAWATAVETLGIVEKSSFKTGEGEEAYKEFFKLSSLLFAYYEMGEDWNIESIVRRLVDIEEELQVFAKLEGLVVSAKHINQIKSDYFLMILDTSSYPAKIRLNSFEKSDLDFAEMTYRALEKENKDNPYIDIVLLSTSSARDIKKAYPNYFLDTHRFITHLKKMIKQSQED